ncbi:sigma factor-like helix-turn-helix DNA-binding protein [Mesorhizobium cantuariense]|uniref:Sigma factor-like helix-turn-helix DNA-binding protein n=1 Tax=Mesorhizobium cantuariense TaxID=1300275 RepID=A0ABV7MH82_9HYPH
MIGNQIISLAINDLSTDTELTNSVALDPICMRRLVDLVQENDVSVRLGNALTVADKAGNLPYATIGDYLDAGPLAQTRMLHDVRNFGRKSAQELETLIRAECASYGIDPSSRTQTSAAASASDRSDLISLFSGDTIGAIACEEVPSTRLEAVLSRPPFRDMTFPEAMENFLNTTHRIAQTRNCGRKSVKEFRRLCERHIRRRLTEEGIGGQDRLVSLIIDKAASADEHSLGTASDTLGLGQDVTPKHERLADRLDWLLSQLDQRASTILRRRNGIGQQGRETLEEIGVDYGVTRERIRQIEAKSLRKLRTQIRRNPIEQMLQQEGPGQWLTIAQGAPVLTRAQLSSRRRNVDAYVTLALDILNIALDRWIDSIALPLPEGWLHPLGDASLVEAVAMDLQQEIARTLLPQALSVLTNANLEDALAACELVLGNPIRLGYVMPPRVGVRLTRLIGLHALLAAAGQARPVEDLLPIYHAHFANDLCSERDAEIVMSAAPHLFLEIEEGSWLAVGAAGTTLKCLAPADRAEQPQQEEPGTIAHALQIALQARGPTRLGDLLNDADAILPQGRSANSIGPILITRRELFIRVLPGTYGLPEHVSAISAYLPDDLLILFNDNQARLYALARYAGEPRTIFPFWTPTAEFKLCRWARHSGDADVFNSLLSVADPDDWPVVSAERANWQRLKYQQGRFAIGMTLRRDAAYELPPLERVLAACVYAHSQGGLNWIAANRLSGRRIDSHAGAGLVALLVCLGVLEEPDGQGYQWQLRHTATSTLDVVRRQLTQELANTGELDWSRGAGTQLARQVSHAIPDPKSWISHSAVVAMLEQQPEALVDETSDDPFEWLMAERRRSREARQREANLQWLLAE